jgi:hypothetical protein
MAPRFVFAAFSIVLAIAVIFAAVTTAKHIPGTRAGASAMRVGWSQRRPDASPRPDRTFPRRESDAGVSHLLIRKPSHRVIFGLPSVLSTSLASRDIVLSRSADKRTGSVGSGQRTWHRICNGDEKAKTENQETAASTISATNSIFSDRNRAEHGSDVRDVRVCVTLPGSRKALH